MPKSAKNPDSHPPVNRPPGTDAAVVLADGAVYWGFGAGAPGKAVGEVCFNTSMTGYQEIFTDPSYAGQIVVLCYPQIGNYGANAADPESVIVVFHDGVDHAGDRVRAVNGGCTISQNFHALDPEKHVRIHCLVRPGSQELVDLFMRQKAEGIVLANDTSCGVVTIKALASDMVWATVKGSSPVPGGESITR